MYSYNKKILFEAQHFCQQRTALSRRRLHTNFLRSAQCLIISSARKNETTRAWTSESARAGALRGRSAKSFSPVKVSSAKPPNPLFLVRQVRLLWSSRRPSRISLPSCSETLLSPDRGLHRKFDSQDHRIFTFLEKIHFPTVAMDDNP